jgi:endoglucanase
LIGMALPTTRRIFLERCAAAAGSALTASALRVRSGRAAAGARLGPLAGINLAGADFGNVPGRHGREYLYPTRDSISYYRDLGFNLVRLPFKWERLQPDIGAAFATSEQALLFGCVEAVLGAGMSVVLDPHNYAKRRVRADNWSTEHVIGTGAVPSQAFADFWARLAAPFKDEQRIMFGLMNEPVDLSPSAWLEIANAAIVAIRRIGATNLILVPGIAYTGAHSWIAVGNTAMARVEDPIRNFALEVHQYFDPDSSGTHPEAVSGTIGSERVEAFQSWARQNGCRAFLGEFNGGRNRTSYNALHDLCQELSANDDVWLGWAAWAGGPRWPDADMFNLEPWSDGRIREQTEILAHYARSPASAWRSPGAQIDIDFARGRIFGMEHADAGLPSRSRDPKGIWLADGNSVPVTGRLLALLQQPRFTLVLGLRDLSTQARACEILSVNGTALLRRTAEGRLEAGFEPPLRTPAQTLRNWAAKRRIAMACDREAGTTCIAVTGAAPVLGAAAVPPVVRASVGAAGSPTGYLTRLTGYEQFVPADALADLIA